MTKTDQTELQRLRDVAVAAHDLLQLGTPFSAYQRWTKDGNTADADKLQEWEDARIILRLRLEATA